MPSPHQSSTDSDAQLITRCRAGDRHAYEQIISRYQTLVCSVAYSGCGDLHLSEDLSQEAFLIAWDQLTELRDADRFKAWICTIVRNLAKGTTKRQQRSVLGRSTPIETADELPALEQTPDARAVSAEQERLVWKTLEGIPELYREPMILFYREEQSVARVAAALDLSEDAVKQRLLRGRKMLQQEFTATIEESLTVSKPATAFTAMVLTGLSSTVSKTTVAGGTQTAAVAAKSAASFGWLGLPSLVMLAQLPIIGWLIRSSFQQARSEAERKLTMQFYVKTSCILMITLPIAFSSIWWLNRLPDIFWLRASCIPILFAVPQAWGVWASRRLGQQIKQLRIEEGTMTPPRPLFDAESHSHPKTKTLWIFGMGSCLVIAWPSTLAILSSDWSALATLLLISLVFAIVASAFAFRWPTHAFQFYGLSISLTMLPGIIALWWRQERWTPGIEGFGWFFLATTGMATTAVILTTLMYRKIHGKSPNLEP